MSKIVELMSEQFHSHQRIRSGDFNLADAPRSSRHTAMEDDDLKPFVEDDPSQTVSEKVQTV